MKGSYRIGKIAGIGIYLHITFFLLLAWVALSGLLGSHGLLGALEGVLWISVLFGVVVLHELGHALTARRFGIPTKDITLLPIGGVARLEWMPTNPKQELLVALAGPAVNVALAALAFCLLSGLGGIAVPSGIAIVGSSYLAKFMWVNVALAVFNLLPAFPMDGGRVLRALLAMRTSYPRATRIAARTGQGMAVLFGLTGLMINPMLLLIAVFIWLAAASEAALVQTTSSLSGYAAHHAMKRDFQAISSSDRIGQAMQFAMRGFQRHFPVVDGNRVVGILTCGDVATALAEHGPNTAVGQVMQPRFETADPFESLDGVFTRMQSTAAEVVLVLDDGQIVGLITAESLEEFLRVRAFPSRDLESALLLTDARSGAKTAFARP